MRIHISIAIASIVAISLSYQANAQYYKGRISYEQQRAIELREQEIPRYNAIVDSRNIDYYMQYINDYPRGSRTPEIQRRANEINLWNLAEYEDTADAYQNYLSTTKYHWYDREAKAALTRIKEERQNEEWQNARLSNTIADYKDFVKKNPDSKFAEQAAKEINRLEGEAEWRKIFNTDNVNELKQFIDKYPEASEINMARDRMYELQGYDYFTKGDYEKAYTQFAKIPEDHITSPYKDAYNLVMERHDFAALSSVSGVEEITTFLEKYPTSPNLTTAYNYLAIATAKSFPEYATQEDYGRALSYAGDTKTKQTVEYYIKRNKQEQKDREKELKAQKRKNNGGWVMIGYESMDFGFNWKFTNQVSAYYNMGVWCRIGNSADPVQFSVGVQPGVIARGSFKAKDADDSEEPSADKNSGNIFDNGYSPTIKPWEEEYSDWLNSQAEKKKGPKGKIGFHMPITARLKVNVCSISNDATDKFFVFGQYHYNAVRIDMESKMGWGAGLGFASKNVDFSIYYRKDIGEAKIPTMPTQHYIGASTVYYF